jgi:hypothetical protein
MQKYGTLGVPAKDTPVADKALRRDFTLYTRNRKKMRRHPRQDEAAPASKSTAYAATHGVTPYTYHKLTRPMQLRSIEQGKPNQNVNIEFFNGRLRDETLNEHGSIACCTQAPKSKASGGNTTRKDRIKHLASCTCQLCEAIKMTLRSKSSRFSRRERRR